MIEKMYKVNLAGCVILQGKSILLLHRKKTDWYELPGGKIDGGETAEQAAQRELKEELLCDIEILQKLGNKDFSENGHIMGYTWFLAVIKQGQHPKIGEPEKFSKFIFVPIADLDKHPLSTNMQNFVSDLKNNKIFLP